VNAERQLKYDDVHGRATAAWERRDYRAALKLYEEQKRLGDGPNVRLSIKQAKAWLAFSEAKTSKEYRRAMALSPKSFSPENLKFVEHLERKEKEERDRPRIEAAQRKAQRDYAKVRAKQEIADLNKAQEIRERLAGMTANLEAPIAPGADTLPRLSTPDGMGGRKSIPNLEFGDPSSFEAASEQAQQGFDNEKSLMGGPVPEAPVSATEIVVAKDPRMVAATAEVDRLREEAEKMDAEIDRATKELSSATDDAAMKALTAELDRKAKLRQDKLAEVAKATEKKTKLHRTIETEEAAKAETTAVKK